MEFLKNNELFSFKYDGIDSKEYLYTLQETSKENTLCREYLFEDALKVTNTSRKIAGFDAYEWVNRFENVSDEKTRVISELWDVDITVPWTHEEPRCATPWQPDRSKHTIIHSTRGSTSGPSDFSDAEKQVVKLRFFEALSQTETARRMGVSQMFVSRAERKILPKLRSRLSGIL